MLNMLNMRAESGHRYNGLSRTDLLARIGAFFSRCSRWATFRVSALAGLSAA
jgi:hypothetical protein